MNRLMHIGFAFAGVPKVLDLEPVFNSLGTRSDWVRYSSTSWLLWTAYTAVDIYWTLAPHLDGGDNVIVAPLDANQMFGRMPPWVWTWIQQKNASVMSIPAQAENYNALLEWYKDSKS